MEKNIKQKSFNVRTAVATLWIVFGAGLLFTYTNCSGIHDTAGLSASSIDTTAILAQLQLDKTIVFTNKCLSCHDANSTSPLKNILDTQYLIANKYIVVGSPQTSILYLKLVDNLMPPAGSPTLSTSEIYTIRDWIAAEGGKFDTYIAGTPIDPGTGTTSGGTATFADVRAILTQNCTSCHSAGNVPPRLDVDAATLRATVYLGQNLVVPNNANGSLLLNSLSSMPKAGALGVNSTAGNTIRAWINSGAL